MTGFSTRFAVALTALLFTAASQAHFQILYTPDLAHVRGVDAPVLMAFSHPVHGGPNMDMGRPEAFYVLAQRGDEGPVKKTELLEYLDETTFNPGENSSVAYAGVVPRNVVRSLGDYTFVLQPAPYYEAGEDKYIQQFTKTVMNVGGVPGNWSEPLGLPAEIRPLDKPYANWVGGVFRGVVLGNGEAVPFAEIEVEYMNYPINIEKSGFVSDAQVALPQDSYGTMSIRANANGEFTIGLPRAGWWGICALNIGPVNEHQGKPLSQDAVLWIEVRDMLPPEPTE
jgi:cobalt/nickel transport protein